jgi:gas vesicle protein
VNGELKTCRTHWFCEEIKFLAKEKINAYMEYRRVQTNEAYENYKHVRNRINSSIRKIKEQYWQKFSTEMENDFYGLQKQVWRMLRIRKRKYERWFKYKK